MERIHNKTWRRLLCGIDIASIIAIIILWVFCDATSKIWIVLPALIEAIKCITERHISDNSYKKLQSEILTRDKIEVAKNAHNIIRDLQCLIDSSITDIKSGKPLQRGSDNYALLYQKIHGLLNNCCMLTTYFPELESDFDPVFKWQPNENNLTEQGEINAHLTKISMAVSKFLHDTNNSATFSNT